MKYYEVEIPLLEEVEEKSIIMQQVNHIGEQEKHFNTLETQYRMLASTWLLGSLGASGWILQKSDLKIFDIGHHSDKWIIVGLIGLLGGIGIFLLWLIDMKVYHKLLNSVFLEGIYLEQQYAWLPKIRTNMLISAEGGDVTNSTVLYYLGSMVLLFSVSLISCVMIAQGSYMKIVITIGGMIIISILAWRMKSTSVSSFTRNLREKLMSDKTGKVRV